MKPSKKQRDQDLLWALYSQQDCSTLQKTLDSVAEILPLENDTNWTFTVERQSVFLHKRLFSEFVLGQSEDETIVTPQEAVKHEPVKQESVKLKPVKHESSIDCMISDDEMDLNVN